MSRGGDAKIYILTTGSWVTWPATGSPSNLSEVCEITDSDQPESRTTSERRTRCTDNSGVSIGSKAPLEINCTYLPEAGVTDTIYNQLVAAYDAKTVIAVAYLDGDKDTAGTRGTWSEYLVIEKPRTDGFDAESEVSFNLKQAADRTTGTPERVLVATA